MGVNFNFVIDFQNENCANFKWTIMSNKKQIFYIDLRQEKYIVEDNFL